MLTDFYNIWRAVYWVNLQHETYWFYPPHLRIAATLPWETSA